MPANDSGWRAYARGTDELTHPTLRLDPEALAALGALLAAGGYTADGLEESFGRSPADASAVLSRSLAGESARNTLIKLFFLGVRLSWQEAATALPGLDPDRLVETGVLEAHGADVRARLRLVPHKDVFVAYEPEAEPPDGSNLLANMTVRMHFASALDVSTGPAFHALLAARHTDRVVATHSDPEAAALTSLGALLNGLDNVDCRVGEGLEAVAGHSFGLVTANPSCVISPELDVRGDTACRELVRDVAAHLSEGGFAHVLVSWVLGPGEDWWSPLEQWVIGTGSDAWLLLAREEDPLAYAAARTETEEEFDSWVDYLRGLAADRIASGAVVLRRRSRGSNWVRHEDMPSSDIGPAGDQVVRAFVNNDLLASTPDHDQLLEEVLAVVEPQRIEQTWRHKDEGLELESARVRLEWGFGFNVGVDAYTIELLARVDGRRRLRELFAEIARDSQLEEDTVARAGLPAVRRLLELGFLARAS